MKLLIADDDLTSRTLLESLALKWGYTPVLVEDGEAAWQVLQQENPPRLLLIDWEMPRLNGLSLCQRIRRQSSSDPAYIILLTARNEILDIVIGLEAGANEYITKPFNKIELQSRLQVGNRMLHLQAELNQAKEILAFQASHDVLTELLNRRAIMDALDKEIARAQRQPQTLCVALC
ncbi:MAG: response regulator, partial [Nitrosomonadaceae bacterium]|nr:response regulator [Nitrosomonadaceae bacterium]